MGNGAEFFSSNEADSIQLHRYGLAHEAQIFFVPKLENFQPGNAADISNKLAETGCHF